MEQTSYYNYNRTEGAELPYNQASEILVYSNPIVTLLGVPGNSLVILAVILSKRVQNVSSVFIFNLAVADLITCIVVPSFSLVQLQRFYSHTLEPICGAILFSVHTCIGASIYTLAAIALNRFLVIVAPRRIYDAVYRTKYIALQICVIWMIPMSVAIVPSYVFGIGQQGFDFFLHTCAPAKDAPTTATFNNILTFVLYPVPLLIIVVSYIGILLKVRSHDKRLAKHGVTRTVGGKTENLERSERELSEEQNNPSKSIRFSKVEKQITKNLFIIFVAYMLCLTPESICVLVTCPIDENYTRHVILFNSVVNPFIYGVKHPLFREVFICILRCRTIPEPSAFLTAIQRKRRRYST